MQGDVLAEDRAVRQRNGFSSFFSTSSRLKGGIRKVPVFTAHRAAWSDVEERVNLAIRKGLLEDRGVG